MSEADTGDGGRASTTRGAARRAYPLQLFLQINGSPRPPFFFGSFECSPRARMHTAVRCQTTACEQSGAFVPSSLAGHELC